MYWAIIIGSVVNGILVIGIIDMIIHRPFFIRAPLFPRILDQR